MMKHHFQQYILPYVKQYRSLMASTIVLGFLAVASAAMLTFTSGYLISRASERPETILLVYIPVVAVRTFGISRAVFRYLERLFSHNAVLKILANMRVKLYRALEPQALFIRSRFTTGDLLGTLADDIEHLQDVYIRTIFPTLIGLFLAVVVTISLSLFDWIFALFILLCVLVIIVVYPLFSLVKMKKHQLRAKQLHQSSYVQLTDALFGIRDWMISGRTAQLVEGIMQLSKERFATDRRVANWHQTRTLQLQIVSGIIIVAVGCWAGMQAEAGHIKPVYIAAFTLVVFPILEALLPVSHAIERLPAYEESFRRIDVIEQAVPNKPQTSGDKIIHKDPTNAVCFHNVSYRYTDDAANAVNNFELTIRHKEKVALLGKSGAGKSTLIQLLLGALKANEGDVTILGSPPEGFGERIYDYVSVLNQKPYLFGTTIENNVRLGKPTATREEVEKVVQQVQLNSYIQSLPDGLRTQMEESGQRFSGGERQRIALARILLKDTPIVILDEPTVGLDPKTEKALIETILNVLEHKTVIWITHHLAGVEKMDRVLFMDKGNIVMEGSHQALLEKEVRYRRLFELDRGL